MESATIKIAIAIENGRSLKLRQLVAFAFVLLPARSTPNARPSGHYLTHLWASGSGTGAWREERSGIGREKVEGMDVGSQVSKSNPSHHTSSLPTPHLLYIFMAGVAATPQNPKKTHAA